MIEIETATQPSAEIVSAVARLLPMLSRSAPAPSPSEVAEMVESPSTTLFLARETGSRRIVGILTLAMFRIPTAVRAWIEDVIVAEEARGQGCGELLTRAAIEAARRAGAKTVDLTSRPSREAANRLYLRMGFEVRNTNVYRFSLRGDDE